MAKSRKTVSIPEYAARRGVTDEAVRKAIKAGRLSKSASKDAKGHWRIIPALADQEWQSNTDPLKVRPGIGANTSATKKPAPNPVPVEPQPTASGLDGEIEILEFDEARKREATYKAELLRLELEQKRGKLVPMDEVIRDVTQTVAGEYTALRQRLLAIPARICLQLARCESAEEIRSVLEEHLTEALCELTADAKTWNVSQASQEES
jgi:hypothetical protein